MCRTPSPIKERPALQENQSPPSTVTKTAYSGTGNLVSKSGTEKIVDGNRSLRKKALGWYEKIREKDIEEPSVPVIGGNCEEIDDRLRVSEMGGNWI